MSHAVLPSDGVSRRLFSEQITTDLLEFAMHMRRFMERRNLKDSTVSHDPLWPASEAARPKGNVVDLLGQIIHARVLKVIWERPDLEPCPYKGRAPQFAGSVSIVSDKGEITFALGALIASFFSMLNSLQAKEGVGQ
jgi:hypothetical protein